MPKLQVALDLVELKRAVEIAKEVEEFVDFIEVGTPLIKSEGMNSIRVISKNFASHKIVADMKTIDTGALEVEMCAKSGADIVIILALSDNSTIEEAVRSAKKYGCEIMADLINHPNPVERAKELEDLGVDYVNVHVGIDVQMLGQDPIKVLKDVVESVNVPVAVAGGLNPEKASLCASLGADIIIVGGNIIRTKNPKESAKRFREAIDFAKHVELPKKSLDEEIREILMQVTTPNVSDAMHRAKAMENIYPIVKGKKVVGKAVTVFTLDGDWAKPVEAIDLAKEGDVIVIKCSGDSSAIWGELATRSCINKRIAGVVIDGAVRDVDDIIKLGFPIFAKKVVPNAGEPKGFGEINVKIVCGGVEVNPGDWIIADDNGVMVIPKKRVYEIARRALEVKKNEDRVRAEIVSGKTLADVIELYKWEKLKK